MKLFSRRILLLPILGGAVLTAHDRDWDRNRGEAGAVYTMTNDAAGNRILVYSRAANGTLTPAGSYSTGGFGSGGGLGNQGGLVLSDSERWLVAVNAGSNDISLFAVRRHGLELADRVPSGGTRPISVAVHRDLVYVLNEGGAGNISGFRIGRGGRLEAIPGSTQPLSGEGADPAQIAFHPFGRVLLVTIKNRNQLLTYTLDREDAARPPRIHISAGATPFGFEFGKRGHVFVSEAAGGTAASSTSSYDVSIDGDVRVISSAVPSQGSAACWLVVTGDGRYAFTSNTADHTISTYRIRFDGAIVLERTTSTGEGTRPLDSALTNDSRFLYVLNSGNGTLSGFRVAQDGELVALPGGISGLPSSTNGMAAR